MENTIVEIKGLSHKYATDWAVNNVSFSIKKQGIFGLLGANGAGKSTIMNILCGVLSQTKGQVTINGTDIRQNPLEAKKAIGFLPQKAPLYLDNTVDEYLNHCAHLRRMAPKEIPAAIERVKQKCTLSHFSKRLIKNLSGGYKQRVGIAGAIIHNPLLVVLDEPTVGLDPVQIVEVRKIIEEIGKDHCVIFSTHIMSEIQAVCHSILMVNQGKLVFEGSVQDFNGYIKPNTILLVLQNGPDPSEFLKIEGVKKAKQLDKTTVRLEFNTDPLVAERIVGVSTKNNWRLTELVIEKSSLDDVFAKITKDASNNSNPNTKKQIVS